MLKTQWKIRINVKGPEYIICSLEWVPKIRQMNSRIMFWAPLMTLGVECHKEAIAAVVSIGLRRNSYWLSQYNMASRNRDISHPAVFWPSWELGHCLGFWMICSRGTGIFPERLVPLHFFVGILCGSEVFFSVTSDVIHGIMIDFFFCWKNRDTNL